jgi:hypothetical protein
VFLSEGFVFLTSVSKISRLHISEVLTVVITKQAWTEPETGVEREAGLPVL